MAGKSMALRVAGRVRRVVYPEVDRLRAEVVELRREVKQERRRRRSRVRAVKDELQALHEAIIAIPDDVDDQTRDILTLTQPYTMTSNTKRIALIDAVRHVVRSAVAGDFVECGVWRGGSVHCMARTLLAEGVVDRDIFLFDTFEGMTEPSDRDVQVSDGRSATELLEESGKTTWVWAIASREDVVEGLSTLDYPQDRFHLVQGAVEQTIPGQAPTTIALLRLDTDWYESTKHELEHLYPRIVPGGVLIIDDYGSWEGSKEATDEYLATLDEPPLMWRAGRARIGIKP